MTLVRIGGQVLDDARHCVACPTLAVAEPYQTTETGRADALDAQADKLQAEVDRLRAEAKAIRAEVESARPRAFICGGCRSRLPRDVIGRWLPIASPIAELPAGGRLDAEPGSQAEVAAITQALAALEANPPRYREPVPSKPRNVHRQRRVSPKAGV